MIFALGGLPGPLAFTFFDLYFGAHLSGTMKPKASHISSCFPTNGVIKCCKHDKQPAVLSVLRPASLPVASKWHFLLFKVFLLLVVQRVGIKCLHWRKVKLVRYVVKFVNAAFCTS